MRTQVSRNPNLEEEQRLTFGQRIADKVAVSSSIVIVARGFPVIVWGEVIYGPQIHNGMRVNRLLGRFDVRHFSYHESSKITGGAMAGLMKVAGVFSKTAREPIESTVAIKGNKMAHRSATHMSVIDLDSKTITNVDFQKKQYSVMTFDEMTQALENMSKKMNKKDSDADVKFTVTANPTGKTKQFGGNDAKEIQMKIAMEVTDQKKNQSGAMVIYTNLWIAENVPGYSEVSNFHRKMAQELNWTPGGNMFMQQPEVAKGMAEAFKEVSKLNGAPVFQVTAMGPEGNGAADGGRAANGGGAAANEKAVGRERTRRALGGRLGGSAAESEPAQEQPAAQQQQQQQTGALIEMQTEYSQFATTADASLFDIPAGFKQVESEMKKAK